MQNKFSNNSPYPPSEDTYFLEDNLVNERGKYALDIGTGSGYLTRTLSRNFSQVIGTDIDFYSLINQNKKAKNRICCDAAEALNCKFDLIICNMPYLSSDEISDRRVDGGKEGVEVPLKIIKSAIKCLSDSGKMLFVTSSLSNYEKLIEESQKLGLDCKIVSRKKLFFEELLIVEAKRH
ncbi:MAG: HemK2/MTQ2 family protein methyltransferase [Nitrosopumilaceae archaeon]